MKITFKFNPFHLFRVSEFCSKDETRMSINGVAVECNPGSKVMFVATDGMHLAALDTLEEHDSSDGSLFVIPSNLTRLMALYAPKKFSDYDAETGSEFENESTYDGALEYDTEGGTISMQVDAIRFEAKSINEKFPNWRTHMPEKPTPCAMNMSRTLFNPYLILRAARFVDELSIGNQLMDIFGEDEKALCFKNSTAFAAVMPGRSNGDPATLAPFK